MSNSISITTPGAVTTSLHLRSTSALFRCTNVDHDGSSIVVTRRWQRLSSGEEMLWQVLAWLNGDPSLPADPDLKAGLDEENYAAAAAAIAQAVSR